MLLLSLSLSLSLLALLTLSLLSSLLSLLSLIILLISNNNHHHNHNDNDSSRNSSANTIMIIIIIALIRLIIITIILKIRIIVIIIIPIAVRLVRLQHLQQRLVLRLGVVELRRHLLQRLAALPIRIGLTRADSYSLITGGFPTSILRNRDPGILSMNILGALRGLAVEHDCFVIVCYVFVV